MKTRDEVQAVIDAGVSVADLKKIATDFYRWWHNQPGANTDQGFDSWLESIKPKEPELLPCPFCGEKVNASVMQVGHKRGCWILNTINRDGFATGEQWDAAWNSRRPGDMTREQIEAVLKKLESMASVSADPIVYLDTVRRLLTEGR